MAAWGRGDQGQLGNTTTVNSTVPVAVNTTGALAGKTVVAVAAGYKHSLARCSDGTVAAWGYNFYGQLGNNSTTNSSVPVAVNTASGVSALFGKTVIAVAAGGYHNLALCSDSTLASWGYGFFGQLGNSTVNDRSVPVAVNAAGVLSGRTVAAMTAGYYHSVVLCSDGAVAAWGYNADGELGDNITNNSTLPVAVNTAGVLSGKTVVAVAGGEGHSLALCADGTLAAWGRNLNGQLGNNSTANSPVAVAVSGSLLASGERYAAVIGGCYASHDFASIVAPVTPGVIASAVTGITLTSATLNGTVNPNGNASTAYFEYGLTPSYGTTASVTLSPNNGTAPQGVSASLTGLPSGTLYHYRLTGTNSAGTASTSDGTFTTISTNANLANLGLSASTLSPAFASATTSYSAIASGTSAINVTPIAADGTASIKVNGVTVASGSASGPVSVASGSATITIVVAAQDGTTAKTYTATVTKAPLTWTYCSVTEGSDWTNGCAGRYFDKSI